MSGDIMALLDLCLLAPPIDTKFIGSGKNILKHVLPWLLSKPWYSPDTKLGLYSLKSFKVKMPDEYWPGPKFVAFILRTIISVIEPYRCDVTHCLYSCIIALPVYDTKMKYHPPTQFEFSTAFSGPIPLLIFIPRFVLNFFSNVQAPVVNCKLYEE